MVGVDRHGVCFYGTRFGHVGDDVYVEVPENKDSDGHRELDIPSDMIEVKTWEFVKACEEAGECEGRCYVMTTKQ